MTIVVCFAVISLLPLLLAFLRVPKWTPIYVFNLFWWIQFAICYVLFPKTEWSVLSAFYIFGCGFTSIIGFLLTFQRRASFFSYTAKTYEKDDKILNIGSAKRLLSLYIGLGFVYSFVSMLRFGFSVRTFFNVDNLLQMNNQMAILRYSSHSNETNLLNQILLSFLYAAPMVAGSFFPYAEKTSEKALCFVSFFPNLMILFSQNLKAGFIGSLIFFTSGYLTSHIRLYGKIRFSAKVIRYVLIVTVLIFIMLFSSMLLRTGTINERTIAITRSKFTGYAFGHVAAIDAWINEHFLKSSFTLGAQTFIGIARYLGLSSRVQGVYQDIYVGPDLRTNVFSYFRGIYQDYGFFGSLFFFFLTGIITGSAYGNINNKRKGSYLSETVMVIQYSFLLYFIVSVFSYASYIVAFFLHYIYVCMSHSRYKIILGTHHVKLVAR